MNEFVAVAERFFPISLDSLIFVSGFVVLSLSSADNPELQCNSTQARSVRRAFNGISGERVSTLLCHGAVVSTVLETSLLCYRSWLLYLFFFSTVSHPIYGQRRRSKSCEPAANNRPPLSADRPIVSAHLIFPSR